jgi:hypothetical protein
MQWYFIGVTSYLHCIRPTYKLTSAVPLSFEPFRAPNTERCRTPCWFPIILNIQMAVTNNVEKLILPLWVYIIITTSFKHIFDISCIYHHDLSVMLLNSLFVEAVS